ncbi:Alpha/Beta hydrolase protein [Polychytrium aggregatum]|uniref:Alpha/Beta hydrolase protein n=1 Tax=Polychytrium aggregatum TaxID=110093 RepID=UPI0022FDDC55|nr:Alpha/Beta hydrolase protein [Polychytrium aggregatum]KAI9206114.1 Alpha/Beta hydrolase protein [Polychytrium aggregatum]
MDWSSSYVRIGAVSLLSVGSVWAYRQFFAVQGRNRGCFRTLKAQPNRSLAYREDVMEGSAYASLSTGETHYYLLGPQNGEKLVFFQGMSSVNALLLPVLRQLVDNGYRVLIYDYYGRGYSDAPRVPYNESLYVTQGRELVEHIGWSKFQVLGFSLGGAIATSFASQYPEKVTRLALAAPAGLMESLALPAKIARLPVIGDLFAQSVAPFILFYMMYRGSLHLHKAPELELWRSVSFDQVFKHPGFMAAYHSTLVHFPFTGLAARYEKLGALGLPVLLLWGTNDRVVPYRLHQRVMQLVPQATFVSIPNTAHELFYESLDQVARPLLEYLQASRSQ